MNSDGSNQTRLTFTPGFDGNPILDALGQTILFDAVRNNFNRDIYRMAVNGTQLKRLTQSESVDAVPAISPDGRTIAWCLRWNQSGRTNIYTMNADGTGVRQLTREGGETPAWSPDGRRLAFSADAPSDGRSNRGYGVAAGMLATMNRDGTDVKMLRAGLKPQYSPRRKTARVRVDWSSRQSHWNGQFGRHGNSLAFSSRCVG